MKNWKLPMLFNTPPRLIIALGLFILASEFFIMTVIGDALSSMNIPDVYWHFLDSILLTIIISPALYSLVFLKLQSEGRFRQINASAQDAIVIVDEQGRLTDWNPAAQRMFQYSREEALGQQMHQLLAPPSDRADADRGFAQFQKTGEGPLVGKIREVMAIRKDGSKFPIEIYVSALKEKGRWHAVGIMRDITGRMQAQKALRDSRENLHRLLNSIAEGAYGVDTNGNCTFVNRAFLQMLGYQNDSDVMGKHVHELIHHSHADGSPYPAEECRAYRAYRINQSINVSDEVFWRKDGIAIPVEYWSHPIEADGATIGAIVTFVDITERKRAEDKLRESEEKFSKVFESNPAMVAIGTLDGKMVDVNLSYADFLGFPRKEMLGKSLADLGVISAEELQRLLELELRAGASLRNVEVSLRARGGSILNALLTANLVLLGGVPYRLATLQDITARKQAETQIAEQLDELRRWHEATSGREARILELKHEVNELLGKAGQPPRYPSAEPDGGENSDV